MWQVSVALGALLGLMLWLYTGQVEKRVEAQIAAVSAQAGLKYAQDTATKSQEFNDKLGAQKAESTRMLGEKNAEIAMYRERVDGLAQKNPAEFGDNFAIDLGRAFCMLEAGNNYNNRAACRDAPDEAYDSDFAFTVTVTQENAATWADLCDDDPDSDFCGWSRTGLSAQGTQTILGYLYQLDAYALEQGNQIDGLHDIIKQITKPTQD